MDASDRKQIRAAEKSAARAERNRGEVLRGLASTTAGRQYLWEQLERAHIFSTPYSPDTNHTFFNLGEQNAGLRLLADITRFCPEEFIQAMREANARRSESEHASDATATGGAATSERSEQSESRREFEGPAAAATEYEPTERD